MRSAAVRWRAGGAGRTGAVAVVAGGFAVVALLVLTTGGSPAAAVAGWFAGAFGTGYAAVQTLTLAVPLLLVALGVGPALRAGLITVGADGQIAAGAAAAALVAVAAPGLPAWLALPAGVLAGAVGGLLWVLGPALAHVRFGVEVILSTLLLNYLAAALLGLLLRTVLRDPDGSATLQGPDLPAAALLPVLPLPGRLHAGALLVGLAVLVALWWVRGRGALLLEVLAERPALAARAGLVPRRAAVRVLLLSGAVAGVVGWMQVAGADGRLLAGTGAGIGFAGLVVAVLGAGRPAATALAAVAYASLSTGSTGIQIATGTTPAALGTVTQGLLLLAVALAVAHTTRARLRRDRVRAAGPVPEPTR